MYEEDVEFDANDITWGKAFILNGNEFENYSMVTVHDYFELGGMGLEEVVNYPYTIICAWCYSKDNPIVRAAFKKVV